MLKLSANISMLFCEVPFLERFKAARDAGFEAVEFLYPEGVSSEVVVSLLGKERLAHSLANMPFGPADLGVAAVPGQERVFEQRMREALRYANVTGCKTLHALAGKATPARDQDVIDRTLIQNLRSAASLANEHGVTVVLEAINRSDVPDFALNGVHHAAHIVEAVSRPNVRLLLDLYHVGRLGEDVHEVVRQYGPTAGYVQVAGFKGRHEPDDGAADYVGMLCLLWESGYRGWVGCEYRPLAGTVEGLSWLSAFM